MALFSRRKKPSGPSAFVGLGQPAPEPAQPPAAAEAAPEPVAAELAARRAQATEIAARRPGRPRSGEEPRTKRIGISVSEAEWERIKAAATAAGRQQVSRWCREVVLERVEDRAAAAPAVEVSAGIKAELARMGNNLNQLARQANAGGTVNPGQLAAVRRELQALREGLG